MAMIGRDKSFCVIVYSYACREPVVANNSLEFDKLERHKTAQGKHWLETFLPSISQLFKGVDVAKYNVTTLCCAIF